MIIDGVEEIERSATTGASGNGGDAGAGGRGGDGGAFGDAGAAAGGILNFGTVAGEAAFFGNSGTPGAARPANSEELTFGAGLPGTSGGAGEQGPAGGTGFTSPSLVTPPGAPGAEAEALGPGETFTAGASAVGGDDILNQGSGGSTAARGTILVFAHGVTTSVEDTASTPALRFNLIRIGSTAGDVTVEWEVRAADGSTLSGDDFPGGELPRGSAVLEALGAGESSHANAVETI